MDQCPFIPLYGRSSMEYRWCRQQILAWNVLINQSMQPSSGQRRARTNRLNSNRLPTYVWLYQYNTQEPAVSAVTMQTFGCHINMYGQIATTEIIWSCRIFNRAFTKSACTCVKLDDTLLGPFYNPTYAYVREDIISHTLTHKVMCRGLLTSSREEANWHKSSMIEEEEWLRRLFAMLSGQWLW